MRGSQGLLRTAVIATNLASCATAYFVWSQFALTGVMLIVFRHDNSNPLVLSLLFAPVVVLLICVASSLRLVRHGRRSAIGVSALPLLGSLLGLATGANDANWATARPPRYGFAPVRTVLCGLGETVERYQASQQRRHLA